MQIENKIIKFNKYTTAWDVLPSICIMVGDRMFREANVEVYFGWLCFEIQVNLWRLSK